MNSKPLDYESRTDTRVGRHQTRLGIISVLASLTTAVGGIILYARASRSGNQAFTGAAALAVAWNAVVGIGLGIGGLLQQGRRSAALFGILLNLLFGVLFVLALGMLT